MTTSQENLIDYIEQLTQKVIFTDSSQSKKDKMPHTTLAPYVKAIQDISQTYVATNNRSAHCITTLLDVHAYMLYYLPINAAKILYLLERCAKALPQKDAISILDFGCGPATASLAAAFFLQHTISIDAIDPNSMMLQGASALLSALAGRSSTTYSVSADVPQNKTYDLIFAGNVLNELCDQEASTLLHTLSGRLAPGGLLIVLEPGTMSATRKLMMQRDLMLQSYPTLSIVYPCTHTAACPLMSQPEEWCHTELHLHRSTMLLQLDTLTGFNKHRIKFSSMVWQKGSYVTEGYRVLTDAQKTHAGHAAYLCGKNCAGIITLLKRNRTEQNASFSRAHTHQIVLVAPAPEHNTISKEAIVTLLNDR